MRPNAAYTPKVVVTPFRNQVIELAVFSPPPFASAEEERLNKLCLTSFKTEPLPLDSRGYRVVL